MNAVELLREIAGDPAALSRNGLPETPSAWAEWGAVDDGVDVVTICQFLFLAAFAEGREPYAHRVGLRAVKNGVWRLPEGATFVREARYAQRALFAVGDGWSLYIHRYPAGHGGVVVTATSMELAERIAKQAAKPVRRKIKDHDDRVKLGFWYATANGAINQERSIEAPEWAGLKRNYSAPVAEQLEKVMELTGENLRGKLLLLHGPPGTGKTTALRALGRSWHAWCRTDCVLDPERLLSDPGYLLEVVMGDDDGDKRWRLLILEDCDELIRGGAKNASGQALSRLLNLTDGLLGQGQNVLLAITTNEPLDRLHPAVVRPGRCLAQIEVGPLSVTEAGAWLGDGARVERPMTLAELYARKLGHDDPAADTSEPSIGQYL